MDEEMATFWLQHLSHERMWADFCTMNSKIQHKITSAVPSSCERHGPEPSGSRVQSSWLHGTALVMGERCSCRRGRDKKHKNGNGTGPEEPYLGVDGFKNLEEGSIPSLQI
ncbi:hypothetical protein BYT27DRAFT_7191437 [Phlegmacium glaucopus]|nr:hypothetical protein BYT27DRAFT_7201643 [Phlegmacium glaucopus]KAF8799868.1 hypothetical protein BYT27DRAFT_7200847 [Phlegmacium glaucopus]KAF8802031.1 hypothetical protein BYT27DRAFT_7197503 [Phlegmacium glaucopus]KAF8803243.1 hypothetical protein BYT27DRAFT_7195837 [Phlegmacium glaucopus]KAF8806131.1 hypothetical protein BYT27DRAFT_7191437 [Phlegmacium glaucopus]